MSVRVNQKGDAMGNDLVKQETAVETSPADMVRYAIEKGATIEQLEKFMALKERNEANEAKKAYNAAMASFKADPPKIEKDKTVGYSAGGGRVGYKHASLYNVTQKINAALSAWGLSATWATKQEGKQIAVTCTITHKFGHSESTTLSAEADNTGSKNGIQAIGSTITYLERYTLLALTGLATFEQDDDGQAAVTAFIDEKELNQILDLIAEKEANITKFLAYLKIEALEKMPKAMYTKAIAALQAKTKKV